MAIVREYVRDDPPYHGHEYRRTGSSDLIWAVVLIVLLALLFTYGLPIIRNIASRSGTQINIPDRIDVNVNNPDAQPAPQGGGPPQPMQPAKPAQP